MQALQWFNISQPSRLFYFMRVFINYYYILDHFWRIAIQTGRKSNFLLLWILKNSYISRKTSIFSSRYILSLHIFLQFACTEIRQLGYYKRPFRKQVFIEYILYEMMRNTYFCIVWHQLIKALIVIEICLQNVAALQTNNDKWLLLTWKLHRQPIFPVTELGPECFQDIFPGCSREWIYSRWKRTVSRARKFK